MIIARRKEQEQQTPTTATTIFTRKEGGITGSTRWMDNTYLVSYLSQEVQISTHPWLDSCHNIHCERIQTLTSLPLAAVRCCRRQHHRINRKRRVSKSCTYYLATRCLRSASRSDPLIICLWLFSSTAAAARPRYRAAFVRRSS